MEMRGERGGGREQEEGGEGEGKGGRRVSVFIDTSQETTVNSYIRAIFSEKILIAVDVSPLMSLFCSLVYLFSLSIFSLVFN